VNLGTARDATEDASWGARRWVLLCVLSGNMLLDAVGVSVVLIALPTIGDQLGAGLGQVQWLMSGFAFGFAAALLLGARITARFGRRSVYLTAMLVFALASAAGGWADALVPVILVRLVQGACAALTAPAGLTIINETFPAGVQLRRAVSVYSLFGATGFTVGLLLSAVLVEADWRWVLVFPVPVVLILLAAGWMVLPRDRGSGENRRIRPALLRNPDLLRAALGAFSLNGAYQGLLLLITFQLQEDRGWTPLQTALALLPACVPLILVLPFSARLAGRYGSRRLIAIGALLPLLGCLLYLARPAGDAYPTGVLPVLLLVEAGFCAAFAALNLSALASVPVPDRAAGVRLYQAFVQFAPAVVLPLVGLLLSHFDSRRPALGLIAAVAALGPALNRPRPAHPVPTSPNPVKEAFRG
jgi:MFS family permease